MVALSCLQADSMTKPELRAFRKTVREALVSANKESGHDVMYK